jgi:hypothetical protein
MINSFLEMPHAIVRDDSPRKRGAVPIRRYRAAVTVVVQALEPMVTSVAASGEDLHWATDVYQSKPRPNSPLSLTLSEPVGCVTLGGRSVLK